MRKRIDRGTLTRRFRADRSSEGGGSRRGVQLSFTPGRQTCLWYTGNSYVRALKH